MTTTIKEKKQLEIRNDYTSRLDQLRSTAVRFFHSEEVTAESHREASGLRLSFNEEN